MSMIITGDNLLALVRQHKIIDETAYDRFSLSLSLDGSVTRFRGELPLITYGQEVTESMMERVDIPEGYVLNPGEAVLACSAEKVKIPPGYMGLLQTKGSLARLFVTVHCCDSQIESGFRGKVTFELCNMGRARVRLTPGQKVAQMYLFRTSSDMVMYDGIYRDADEPTMSKRNYNHKDK